MINKPHPFWDLTFLDGLTERVRLYTSVRRNAISSRFVRHEILAWFLSRKFRQVFYAKILCQKFWHGASILAQNFGTEFRHEIPCQKFWQVFPCQNSEPKFWHRAKTFGKKWYFGTQMNRPKMSICQKRIVKKCRAFCNNEKLIFSTFQSTLFLT